MRRSHSSVRLAVIGLAVAVTAGCASETATTATAAKPSPATLVAERQRLMKLTGAAWADAQAKAKAGNIEGIAVSAETIALNARQIPALFPAGSMTDQSKAKPEIWQKFPEFEAAAKNMEAESEKLRDAARAKNQQAVEAIMKDYGRVACGSCHTPFRVPPPRQG